jgi:hypothetical protein
MRDRHQVEFVDPREIVRVAGVEGQLVCDRCGGDQGVIRPGRWLAAAPTKVRGHSSEGARRRRIEGDGLEIGLRLLEMGLTSGTFRLVARQQRSDGQLGQSHGAYRGLLGQELWVS